MADFVVVANRLPVDMETLPDGTTEWRASPGGLVTALAPMLRGRVARIVAILLPVACIAMAWHTQNRWFDKSVPGSFVSTIGAFPSRIGALARMP
jgi:trehalose-6-phosphate synthase